MKRLLALLAVLMSLSLMACSEETTELVLDIAIDVLEQSGQASGSEEASGSGAASSQVSTAEPGGDSQLPEPPQEQTPEAPPKEETPSIDENGSYTTKEDVALYIHTYGRLPNNFITKKEAEKLGWPGGDLRLYAPGKCIGGDRFGNYEGLLPEKKGRTYKECDIDTLDASKRGAKRIVFSNDGLIYYTGDHYKSFELLYGEETK